MAKPKKKAPVSGDFCSIILGNTSDTIWAAHDDGGVWRTHMSSLLNRIPIVLPMVITSYCLYGLSPVFISSRVASLHNFPSLLLPANTFTFSNLFHNMSNTDQSVKEKKTYHKKATGDALNTVKWHSKEDELKLYGSCFWYA
jgi:hypothetical protein